MPYLWLKAIHVAAVLIFIGGLFSQSLVVASGGPGDTNMVRFVSTWDRCVTLPAMLTVWLSGALAAATGGWFASPWLWAKLCLVVALTGLHGVQSGRLRRLRRDGSSSPKLNPLVVPGAVAVCVAVIAALAVAKPF
jgi:putative membrane protein